MLYDHIVVRSGVGSAITYHLKRTHSEHSVMTPNSSNDAVMGISVQLMDIL